VVQQPSINFRGTNILICFEQGAHDDVSGGDLLRISRDSYEWHCRLFDKT